MLYVDNNNHLGSVLLPSQVVCFSIRLRLWLWSVGLNHQLLSLGTTFSLDTPFSPTTIPTVTDNAFSEGLIPHKMLGISFEPTTSQDVKNGELTFGGVDTTKYTGEITYVCVLSRFDA